MSKSESLSFSTGDEDHSVVDLTSNKYAGKIILLGGFKFFNQFMLKDYITTKYCHSDFVTADTKSAMPFCHDDRNLKILVEPDFVNLIRE